MLTKDNINGMTRKQGIELLGDFPAVINSYVINTGQQLPSVIFVKLPRELWREIDGGCCCLQCSKDGKCAPAYWDTAALSFSDEDKYGHIWTVHHPELHGATRKRLQWRK